MKYLSVVLLAGVIATACGSSSSSPVSPSPGSSTPTNMTGSWSGTTADSTGRSQMTMNITQNGNSLSGTMGMSDGSRSMMGSGSMSGTVNGSTVTFHMAVPNGGFSGMMSSCSMGMDGQMTMSSDGRTMTGTYTGSMSGMMSGGMMGQSCGGAMSGGQITLTR